MIQKQEIATSQLLYIEWQISVCEIYFSSRQDHRNREFVQNSQERGV